MCVKTSLPTLSPVQRPCPPSPSLFSTCFDAFVNMTPQKTNKNLYTRTYSHTHTRSTNRSTPLTQPQCVCQCVYWLLCVCVLHYYYCCCYSFFLLSSRGTYEYYFCRIVCFSFRLSSPLLEFSPPFLFLFFDSVSSSLFLIKLRFSRCCYCPCCYCACCCYWRSCCFCSASILVTNEQR